MDPNARRRSLPDAWLRPPPASLWRGVVGAIVLGWLVLMTVWGVGRSGVPEHAPWFLVAGAVAGVTVTALGIRRARRRR